MAYVQTLVFVDYATCSLQLMRAQLRSSVPFSCGDQWSVRSSRWSIVTGTLGKHSGSVEACYSSKLPLYPLSFLKSAIKFSSFIVYAQRNMECLEYFFQISNTHERDILMHRRGAEAEASGIRLQFPLSRLSLLPRLQYLCRLAIRLTARREQLATLPLPPKLLAYVADPKFLIPNIRECLQVLEERRNRSLVVNSDYAEI